MNTCLRVLKETKWILSFNMFIKIYLVFPRPPFGIVHLSGHSLGFSVVLYSDVQSIKGEHSKVIC